MTSKAEGASGRRLGRYHLAESLGAGPTGEVFRARVHGVAGFERQFAVKRFHPALVADADRAGLLAQAARVYGALQHPRIARLHEFGVAGSETFAATELVRGLDLRRLLGMAAQRGAGLPPGAAAALVAAAARALGFAHSRGLAHLGVCPTNVLCTAEGDVKVTDFGYLALRLSSRPTEEADLVARLAYLAPEQLRGDAGTPATDVFQLGLIACELLTGKAPLAGVDPREVERRAVSGDYPVVVLDLPRPLAQVIRRALAVAPIERFADAGALADALDAAARAAPLAGDRRDLAAVVRAAVEQAPVAKAPASSGTPAARVPPPRSGPMPAAHVTLTGRPPPRHWPTRAAPQGDGGPARPLPTARGSAPPSGLQAGQAVPAPSPSAVLPSAQEHARPERGPEAPRPPILPERADTSEEPTRVRDEEQDGPPTRVRGQEPGGAPARARADDEEGPPTRVMPDHMMRTLVGQPSTSVAPSPSGVRSNGARQSEPRGRGRDPDPGEAGDDEALRTRPHPRLTAESASDPFERDSDGDFYAVDTVTQLRAEGPPPAPAPLPRAAARPTRPDTGTPLPEVHSPPPDVLTPMPELAQMLAMTPPPRPPPPPPRPSPMSTLSSSSPPPPRPPDAAPGSPPRPPAFAPGLPPRPPEAAPGSPRPPAFAPGSPPRPPESAPGLPPRPPGSSPGSPRPSMPTAGSPPSSSPAAARSSSPPSPHESPMATPSSSPPIGAPPRARPTAEAAQRDFRQGPDPWTGPMPPDPRIASGPHVEPDPRFVLDPGNLPDPRPRSPLNPAARDPAIPQPDPPQRRLPRSSGTPGTDEVMAGQAPWAEVNARSGQPADDRSPGGRGRRALLLALLLLLLSAGGYVGFMALFADQVAADLPAATPGASPRARGETPAPAAKAGAAAAPTPGTAAGAGPSAAPVASPATGPTPGAPAEPTLGELTIQSQPPRARAYLDGALVGRTPLTIESSADRYKLAIIMPGYKPHIAEIDGRGAISVTLAEVTPPNGPAGIKIRCRQKNRYYVTLDGAPTGQLCPTERLGVELGEHTAEIYDPVTDSRRAYKIRVDQTRLSVRVRVD